jgi:plastocyanin
MSRGERVVSGGWLFLVVVILLAAGASRVSATVRVVQFGGSVGLTYSPDTFTATVGDTVRWQGNFSFHPISSTSVPAGADTWQNSTGTTFDYVIKVAGAYTYQCDVHAPAMVGSFSAVLTGVEDTRSGSEPAMFRLGQNFPNPFNPATVIGYQLPARSAVKLSVYSLLGSEVAVLVNGVEGAGSHEVRFDAAGLPSGVYLYRLAARSVDGGQAPLIQTRKMVVLR